MAEVTGEDAWASFDENGINMTSHMPVLLQILSYSQKKSVDLHSETKKRGVVSRLSRGRARPVIICAQNRPMSENPRKQSNGNGPPTWALSPVSPVWYMAFWTSDLSKQGQGHWAETLSLGGGDR
jgi:hypothetical protein